MPTTPRTRTSENCAPATAAAKDRGWRICFVWRDGGAEHVEAPHGVSQSRLARDIDVNPARINDIVHGRSAITAAIALRLAKYFRTTPELWLNLQSDYDLRRA